MHSEGLCKHRKELLTSLIMKLGSILLRCKRRKTAVKEGFNEPDHWYQDLPRKGIRMMIGENLDGPQIQGELRKLRIGDRPRYIVKNRID